MRNISEPQPGEFTVLDVPTRVARVTLLLAMSFCIVACSKSTEKPTAKLRPVKYATVGASGVSVAPAISGSIIARDATLLSFRVGGTLAVLNVKMGDTVKKGQLIGKLDDSDYAVALSQAQANFQSAKSQRDAAQNTFNRVERLFESGTSSQADYEGARSNLQAARAQQSAASQVVKQARNQQGYAVLKSPFAGVVNSVSSKQGESVGAGQPIIIVSRGGELEVSVGIPADMVSAVKVGTKVSIEVSALGDKRLPGTVREVSFVSESSTYPARVAFDEALDVLRPGMAAAATFDLGSKVAELSVPASAVANLEEGSFVFVLEPAEGDTFTVTRRSIVLGALIGESFEIEKGIAVGERVAAAGLSSLVDGMKVKLIDSPDKSAPKEAASKPNPGKKVGKPDSEVATPKAPEGVE